MGTELRLYTCRSSARKKDNKTGTMRENIHSNHAPNISFTVHDTRLTVPFVCLFLLTGEQKQQVSLLNDESEQSRSGVKRLTFILPHK